MKNKLPKIKFLLFIGLCWFIIHTIYIAYDGLNDDIHKADVAVVLGTTVHEDGTLSNRLKKRLDCGLALYKNNQIETIIVSGGLGKEGHYEGDAMKNYLIRCGVPNEDIIVDNEGNNTRATVQNVIKLQEKYNFKSITVVSQYFHITRTKMLFRKNTTISIYSASPYYFEFRDVYSLIREFFGYYLQ